MTNQININGITYNILADEKIGTEFKNIHTNNNGGIVSTLILQRPNGTKKFWAVRNNKGIVEII